MHPIERLRYVARASGADQRVLVRETAGALRGLGVDPAGLVTSARRIVERHPSAGALWWLCARMLAATEPHREGASCVDAIEADPTPELLLDDLPDEATVTVLGWPDLAAESLLRRGDASVLVIDVGDEGSSLVRRFDRADIAAELVDPSRLSAAVLASDVVLIEATAAGPDAALCPVGSRAAASVAYCSEVPVWLVAGVGRRLPSAMFTALCERVMGDADPWDLDDEVVPAGLFHAIVGPSGRVEVSSAALAAECPLTHELLRPSAW